MASITLRCLAVSDVAKVALLCGGVAIGVFIGSYIGCLILGVRFK